MTNTNQTTFSPRTTARLSAYATLAGAALASPALAPNASAAVITSGPVSIAIPNTIDGVYFNIITGVTGTSAATVTGWDINPYNNNAGLTFYGTATPYGILASGTAGTTAVAQRLTGGETIGPASTFFNQFQTTGGLFQNTGVAYVGVKFLNEATTVANYGWLRIQSTAGSGTSLGFPATIIAYAYENAGLAITVPTVPEPTTTAALGLGVMALGATGVRRWRRGKQTVA